MITNRLYKTPLLLATLFFLVGVAIVKPAMCHPLRSQNTPELKADTNTACQGDSVMLRLVGGGVFTLHRNGSPVGLFADSVQVGQSGSYTATTLVGTDTLTSAAVLLNFLVAPNAGFITPADTLLLCPGDSITITANRPGFWYFNQTNMGNSAAQLTAKQAGTYYRVLSNMFCADTTAPLVLIHNANPNAGSLSHHGRVQLCLGDSLSLTANQPGGWYRNGVNLFNKSQTIRVGSSGQYYRVLGIGSCADTTHSLDLQVVAQPNAGTLLANGAPTLCLGDSLLLATNGTGQWHLNNAPLADSSDTLWAQNAGAYYRVAGGSLCSDTSNQVIIATVPRPFAGNAPMPDSITLCSGQATTLHTNGNGTWFFNNQTLNTTADTINPTDAGLYYRVDTNAFCADTSGRVWVNVLPLPNAGTLLANGAPTLCLGDSLLLATNGTGQWHLNNAPLADSSDTLWAQNAGAYYRVAGGSLCSDTSNQVIVATKPTDTLTLELVQPANCKGDLFTVSVSNGTGGYKWWLNDAIIKTGPDTLLVTELTGKLVVTSTDSVCTPQPDTLLLAYTDSAENHPPLPDKLICAGQTATIVAPDTNAVAYYWNGQPGSFVYTTNTFGLVYLEMATTCTTYHDTIKVDAKPIEKLPTQTMLVCPGDMATLSAMEGGSAQHQWSTGATTTSIQGMPNNTYTLVYQKPDSCLAEQVFDVVEDNCPQDLFVPDGFSPNNDGANDFFTVYCGSCQNYKIQIFNRWGEMVFKSNSLSEPWNGYYRGQQCQPGEYYYRITFQLPAQSTKNATGYIKLVH